MSAAHEKIAFLRATLAKAGPPEIRVPLGHVGADACLAGGLKKGALHEVFAIASHETAATGFTAALAARIGGPLLWIRQDYAALEHGELAATGFLELGLDPSRILLLRVPDVAGALRAASDALTCKALGTVVIEIVGAPKLLDLVAHRRLALGTAESGVTALLLRFGAEPDIGVAETRWCVRAAPSGEDEDWGRPVFDAALTRNRHGPPGQWAMEWSCDDGEFRPADPGAVVSAPADRPAQAAMAQASAA